MDTVLQTSPQPTQVPQETAVPVPPQQLWGQLSLEQQESFFQMLLKVCRQLTGVQSQEVANEN